MCACMCACMCVCVCVFVCMCVCVCVSVCVCCLVLAFLNWYKIICILTFEWQESTDGAMFSWAKERDLLSQGPLEFRVQTVPQNAMVCLDKKWRKVLTEMLDKGA